MAKRFDEKSKQRKPHRIPFVVLVSVVVLFPVASILGGYYFYLYLPVGSGPAGPSVPRSAFEKTWTSRQVLLLGVGDSVTEGFGAPWGHSYFDRLVSNPTDEFEEMKGICLSAVIPNLKTQNIATSGSTSLRHVEDIRKLPKFPSEVLGIVMITTGGNDVIHNYGKKPPQEGAMYGATLAQAKPWIEAFEKRLEAMIVMLQERFPGGCHIFLANIYDPTDGDGIGPIPAFFDMGFPAWRDAVPILHAYNDVIARCTQRHPLVHLVNIHDEFMGHGFACRRFWKKTYRPDDPHHWYHVNVEDPNERGYDAIRRLFLLEMIKVLQPRFYTKQKPSGIALVGCDYLQLPLYTQREVSDSQTVMADRPGRPGWMRSQRYFASSSEVEFSRPGMSFRQRWSSLSSSAPTICFI